MDALKNHELIRSLELENMNLRAALVGASDNLRDAEMEIGRLRQEISILKGMMPTRGTLPNILPPVVGAPNLARGPQSIVTAGILRRFEERQQKLDEKMKLVAEISRQEHTNDKGDRVRIVRQPRLGGCYDEQGLTAAQKNVDFDEQQWLTEQDNKE